MIHDNKEGPYTTMDPTGGPDTYKQSKHTPCQAVKRQKLIEKSSWKLSLPLPGVGR